EDRTPSDLPRVQVRPQTLVLSVCAECRMAIGLVGRDRFLLATLLVLGSLPLTGCDRGIRRVPVSGTVTLDGKPLQGGVLLFHPDESKGNTARISATGPVSAGRYQLVTSAVTKKDTGPGAAPGGD